MWRRSTCIDCAVRRDALCGALSIDELAGLARGGFCKRYKAGNVIVGGGEPQLWFGNVVSGVIKLTRTLRDGRLQVVGLLFPGDFLGRPFRGRTPYAAEAATDVELCCFGRREFELFLKEQPSLKQRLLERTLDDVDAARDWIVLLGSTSAGERVATLILYLARRMRAPCCAPREQPPSHFDLPLSRGEMADFLGLRTETISRHLRRLRAAGLIATPGRRSLVVRDLAAIERNVEMAGK